MNILISLIPQITGACRRKDDTDQREAVHWERSLWSEGVDLWWNTENGMYGLEMFFPFSQNKTLWLLPWIKHLYVCLHREGWHSLSKNYNLWKLNKQLCTEIMVPVRCLRCFNQHIKKELVWLWYLVVIHFNCESKNDLVNSL